MANETLTCAENVAAERLSALRDDMLAAAEAERLRAHIAGCAACRARLAEYDALSATLRQRRELEPGERIVEGVRARLPVDARLRTRLRLPARASRRLWAGLAALAPVAAIILLFVYVFGGLGAHQRSAQAATPTASVATATPATTATAEVNGLPEMTHAISGDAAWGAFSPSASFTSTLASQVFVPQALAPDGRTLAGLLEPAATLAPGATPHIELATFDALSHQVTPLGMGWHSYPAAGTVIAIDSRYIVFSQDDAPQEACGDCHVTLWALDRRTGEAWDFDPSRAMPTPPASADYTGSQRTLASADHVAFLSMQGQVWVADLVTRQVTLALPFGAAPATAIAPTVNAPQGPQISMLSFVWPNLIYTSTPYDPAVASEPTTLGILNLQTGVNVTTKLNLALLLASPDPHSTSVALTAAYVSGGALYLVTSTTIANQTGTGATAQFNYGTLYSVANATLGGSAPTVLARWLNGGDTATSVNARLITLGGGYVWDLAERRLVVVEPASTPQPVSLSLSGQYLLALGPMPVYFPQLNGPTQQGAVYDTAQFATR